jgi:hypothetical protein
VRHRPIRDSGNHRFNLPLPLQDVSKGARLCVRNLRSGSEKRLSIHTRIARHSDLSIVSIGTTSILLDLRFRIALGQ